MKKTKKPTIKDWEIVNAIMDIELSLVSVNKETATIRLKLQEILNTLATKGKNK